MYSLCVDFDKYSLPEPVAARYAQADAAALKVAFYLLLNGSATEEQLTEELGLAAENAQRALRFWTDAGLVAQGEGIQKKRKLTTTDLARLSLEDESVPVLMREAQRCLGREISNAESLQLIELYKLDGVAVELALCSLAYSAPLASGSKQIRYACAVAKDWKNAGIESIAQAEAHIKLMSTRSERYKLVADALDCDQALFKTKDKRCIDAWYESLGYNEQFAAEAAARTGNTDIQYINGVLKGWRAKGYNTVKQTRQDVSNAPASSKGSRKKGSMFEDAMRQFEE